jgi:hypothetical protein
MHGLGVLGLALSRPSIAASATSYDVPAHEAHSTEELKRFVRVGIPDRDHPSSDVGVPGHGYPGVRAACRRDRAVPYP